MDEVTTEKAEMIVEAIESGNYEPLKSLQDWVAWRKTAQNLENSPELANRARQDPAKAEHFVDSFLIPTSLEVGCRDEAVYKSQIAVGIAGSEHWLTALHKLVEPIDELMERPLSYRSVFHLLLDTVTLFCPQSWVTEGTPEFQLSLELQVVREHLLLFAENFNKRMEPRRSITVEGTPRHYVFYLIYLLTIVLIFATVGLLVGWGWWVYAGWAGALIIYVGANVQSIKQLTVRNDCIEIVTTRDETLTFERREVHRLDTFLCGGISAGSPIRPKNFVGISNTDMERVEHFWSR